MSLDTDALVDAVCSHALATGLFDAVNSHEPKTGPGSGMYAAVWVQSMRGVKSSGLNSTSVLVVFNVRLYSNMLQEPQDAIDPNIMRAADVLLRAYSADFRLDGLIRNVDLLGQHSQAMGGDAGYLEIDKVMSRVFTLNVPCIVNDLWDQVA